MTEFIAGGGLMLVGIIFGAAISRGKQGPPGPAGWSSDS